MRRGPRQSALRGEKRRQIAMSNVSTNSTGLAPAATDLTVINILTYAFLCIVTFGLASAVTVSEFVTVLKTRKTAFVVGLGSQYLVMPAAARLIATLLDMPDVDALGLILIGCCPGGAMSNAFAYFARADMALSVSMTAVSNGLAFASLPLLLFLWTRGLSDSIQASIPFLEIVGSLLMVLVPAALGVLLRHNNPKWAKRAEKVGAISGGVLVATSTFVGLISNGKSLGYSELFPWKNGFSVCLVAPLGMLFALFAVGLLNTPCCLKLLEKPTPLPVLATVVMETGIQNTVLALAICTLTSTGWTRDAAFRLQLLPIMWGLFVSTEAVLVMFLFRWLVGRDAKKDGAVVKTDGKGASEVL